MKEWIMHYIEEGVEHFYLIDNGSTDSYKSQIEEFKDKITIFVDPTPHKQLELYNKYILPELKNTHWIIGCDLDEFIWSKEGTIADVLKSANDDVGLVILPWEMYGSSGHIEQPKHVVPNFKKRLNYDNPVDGSFRCTKCIGRSNAINELHVHMYSIKPEYKSVDGNLNYTDYYDFDSMSEDKLKNYKIRCSHFPIQSYNWYTNVKAKRGDVAVKDWNNIRDDSYFNKYDKNEVHDDGLYQKHKLLYHNLDKGEMNAEVKEDFVAPWTPEQYMHLSNKKINSLTLLFSIFLLLIIFFLLFC